MVSLTDSLVSASSRILTLKKRPDLSARRQRYLGKNYWIVKDPVGLKYYRFQEEEYAILNMLDGTVSLDDIKQQFEAEFPPQKIKLEELQSFLGQLHQRLDSYQRQRSGTSAVQAEQRTPEKRAASGVDQYSGYQIQGRRPGTVFQLAVSEGFVAVSPGYGNALRSADDFGAVAGNDSV